MTGSATSFLTNLGEIVMISLWERWECLELLFEERALFPVEESCRFIYCYVRLIAVGISITG